jgi:L-ascorbate metabolism protein UlaG (beta-lactamase superfamily)
MKRRQLLQGLGGLTAGAIAPVLWASRTQAKPSKSGGGTLSIRYLGHSAFVFNGDGVTILANPFLPGGCTAKLPLPKVPAQVVLVSSHLLDEGYVEQLVGKPRILASPGLYRVQGIQFQGIRTDHDRLQGRRFGTNVVWRWSQAGISIANLGGAAAPITTEQQVLIGRPDVLILPVGGGDKTYTPAEAKATIELLQPRIVIPSQFRIMGADDTCTLQPLKDFLSLFPANLIRRSGSTLSLSRGSLPREGFLIYTL